MRSLSAFVITVALVIITVDAAAGAAKPGQATSSSRPPVDPETRFEVVSIKPFDQSGSVPVRVMTTPNRFELVGSTLRLMLPQVLGIPANRIVGLPDWIEGARYAIAAKAPDNASSAAMSTMIRNMLKDRFNLVMHSETRELPVYTLVFARNDERFGPALKASSAACQATVAERRGDVAQAAAQEATQRGSVAPSTVAGSSPCNGGRVGAGFADYSGVPIAQLVSILAQVVGRPVIDRTELTSIYDYTLTWAQGPGVGVPGPFGQSVPVAPGDLPAPDPSVPEIFTAVQEQLGLKLETTRAPVEVIVIDRLEKPTLD
jgi:uncharacterized protein (TIGR03435 family)